MASLSSYKNTRLTQISPAITTAIYDKHLKNTCVSSIYVDKYKKRLFAG